MLEREVRNATDALAVEHGLESEGTTSVVLTTRDAFDEDIAPADEPEAEEITEQANPE